MYKYVYISEEFIDNLIRQLDLFKENMFDRIHEMKSQLTIVKNIVENDNIYVEQMNKLQT